MKRIKLSTPYLGPQMDQPMQNTNPQSQLNSHHKPSQLQTTFNTQSTELTAGQHNSSLDQTLGAGPNEADNYPLPEPEDKEF